MHLFVLLGWCMLLPKVQVYVVCKPKSDCEMLQGKFLPREPAVPFVLEIDTVSSRLCSPSNADCFRTLHHLTSDEVAFECARTGATPWSAYKVEYSIKTDAGNLLEMNVTSIMRDDLFLRAAKPACVKRRRVDDDALLALLSGAQGDPIAMGKAAATAFTLPHLGGDTTSKPEERIAPPLIDEAWLCEESEVLASAVVLIDDVVEDADAALLAGYDDEGCGEAEAAGDASPTGLAAEREGLGQDEEEEEEDATPLRREAEAVVDIASNLVFEAGPAVSAEPSAGSSGDALPPLPPPAAGPPIMSVEEANEQYKKSDLGYVKHIYGTRDRGRITYWKTNIAGKCYLHSGCQVCKAQSKCS